MSYVKEKTAFRKLIRVDDFGLEVRDDIVRISLVFCSTLGRRFRALCCE